MSNDIKHVDSFKDKLKKQSQIVQEKLSNEVYIEDDISDHVKESFLKYSLAVIAARAFPDARDGLKPSHRRILYVLRSLNLVPGGKFRKSAKICGDTSGDFHPHGESVIYPTMVRLSQSWAMRYKLVDGQGNFGSIDGDPPGAMRYTEARMTKFASYLMEDLDKDTVDMVSNYDETKKEPVVMPAKFHNLLCNGSSGIAVGMSTYIPPHNLSEVIDATLMMLDDPFVAISELMTALPAPDFPTGGTICGLDGVCSVYNTGRGKIILQGSHFVEDDANGQQNIIIYEIPFGVNKSRLIERIAECVEGKIIAEISNLRDESGRDGMRISVMLRKGSSVEAAINQLYKMTPLRTTISCHMLALDKGAPRVMNIKEMIEVWIDHRENVITRRTDYELNKFLDKLHLLEGYMKVLNDLDNVIRIIKLSKDKDSACLQLISEISINKKQANAVLDLKLYRITALEMNKVLKDYEDTSFEVDRLKDILEDSTRVTDIIRQDLITMRMDHAADVRLTKIERDWKDIDSIESLIPNREVIITLSKDGLIKRFDTEGIRTQRRGGQGLFGISDKRGDMIHCLSTACMHDHVLVFTEKGRCYWLKCWQIPEMQRRAQGQSIASVINTFEETDKVSTLLTLTSLDIEGSLLFCTRRGVVKKTAIKSFSSPRKGGIIAINLDEGDKVISVQVVSELQKIVISTNRGATIKFDQFEINEIGRSTRGVRGIKLKSDSFVVSCCAVLDSDLLVFVAENGYGKRTRVEKIRETKRGGVGVKGINCTKKTGNLVSALLLENNSIIILSTSKGKMLKVLGSEIRISGRATQGVKLISLQSGDRIMETESVHCLVESSSIE